MKQFNNMDQSNETNKKGYVDLNEFVKYCNKYPSITFVNGNPKTIFNNIDTNSSGTISIDEFCTYI
jgi:Ca2+-binding EF-hand superfamily protein